MSGGPVPVFKKYTSTSRGIWEKLRKLLAIVPNRSTGNPVVPYYRTPTPGSRPEAAGYTDPYTVPAGDIADNPYFKRDHRRNYPQIAYYDQATIAGLLTYGSAAHPRIAAGAAGTKALAEVENGQISLTNALTTHKSAILGEVLEKNGQPPIPPSFKPKKWRVVAEPESGMYDESYPVRSFN
ncbi:hypothetical protein TRVA0_017S00936 [Trichomonascus vanleenenianus]|uniref:uncharacterized protein n=1 Tax=Trichomonascus vanleenenianus TaxID=2268995 RepID=UPI003EC969DA